MKIKGILVNSLKITLIVIIFFNMLFIFITFKNSHSIANLYKCSEKEKEYIKNRINMNYDFDYIYVQDNHLANQVMVVVKNKIPFINVYNGTQILVKKKENVDLFSYIKTIYEKGKLIDSLTLYRPFIITIAISILLYLCINYIKQKL